MRDANPATVGVDRQRPTRWQDGRLHAVPVYNKGVLGQFFGANYGNFLASAEESTGSPVATSAFPAMRCSTRTGFRFTCSTASTNPASAKGGTRRGGLPQTRDSEPVFQTAWTRIETQPAEPTILPPRRRILPKQSRLPARHSGLPRRRTLLPGRRVSLPSERDGAAVHLIGPRLLARRRN